MTEVIQPDVETAEFFTEQEIRTFSFDIRQSALLHRVGHQELSSHSGLALGPHTKGPYWCAVNTKDGHSPSPSPLILSALWNPSVEPTRIIPLPPILEKIGVTNCLALTMGNFQFTRSDSFVSGKGEDGRNVSILEFDDKAGPASAAGLIFYITSC